MRRTAYRALSKLGDVANPTPVHFARKAAYRGASRVINSGCLLPVVVVAVVVFYGAIAIFTHQYVRAAYVNLIGWLT
jgi:hypothetical protein